MNESRPRGRRPSRRRPSPPRAGFDADGAHHDEGLPPAPRAPVAARGPVGHRAQAAYDDVPPEPRRRVPVASLRNKTHHSTPAHGAPRPQAAPAAPPPSQLLSPATGRAPTGLDPRVHRPTVGDPRSASREKLAEIGGDAIYHGTSAGNVMVIGLFDADHPSSQLEYWVEVDGSGPYVLEGLRPGRYELHACLCSELTENGLPKDVLATGIWNRGAVIQVGVGEVFRNYDIEIFDEVPSGLLQGIDTVFYDVIDLDAAVEFYQAVLGLSLTFRERSWAEFDTGSSVLALRRRPAAPTGVPGMVKRPGEYNGAIVVFRVTDHDAVRRELTNRGVKFLGPAMDIPDARWSTFKDPDGNRCQIFERKH